MMHGRTIVSQGAHVVADEDTGAVEILKCRRR